MSLPNIAKEFSIPFRHKVQDAIIPIGQQISQILDFQGLTLLGLLIPASFTSTEITFNAGGFELDIGPAVFSYHNVNGTEVKITVAANRYVGFAALDMAPVRFLQLKTDIAEVAERDIKVICMGI
ncbi:MAG: hypothetical protein V3S42_04630 [Candidatus Neomarinimicrobiota bacterium]